MSETTGDSGLAVRPADRLTPWLFALAIFTSASLVFVVQPMVTKLVLPMLGGSPAVWNTAMVFFQAALLAGYLYAHLLQRVASIRLQVVVHLGLLLAAALFLPLHVNGWLGDPNPAAPIGWLLATLALSVGAPFAVLSATAPLLQAWFARVRAGHADGKNPYVLYAASNLGSFLALLSYPFVIEPLATLFGQRMGWTAGYVAFVLMVAGLALIVWRRREDRAAEPARLAAPPAIPWRAKAVLILLAAAPSSLMLGVTAHLSTDVASAPFLWVIPLALYLLTFVIAFQARPWIPLPVTLVLQAGFGAVVVMVVAFETLDIRVAFVLHIAAFFFAALMCHQMLAGRRPPPDRLTEFYLLLSVGGVVGGAFTALLAPVMFDMVWEYPLVLVLVGLARPWARGRLRGDETGALVAIAILAAGSAVLSAWMTADAAAWGALWRMLPLFPLQTLCMLLLAPATVCAFLLRDRAQVFTAALLMIALSAQFVTRGYEASFSERSFFGVMRVAERTDQTMGGTVHILTHGTTWHGAQARHPRYDCLPGMYYHPFTPIGEATEIIQARGPARIGVVGQGAGTMAAFKRAEDRLTYFEIDPAVDRMSRDPRWFTYISDCAVGEVDTVLGDARLTLANQPAGTYDLLLIDAFSSDAVPTHLLTVEAIEGYLRLLKPDGVVLLHLSNRNLEIVLPTVAAAHALGRPALHGLYLDDRTLPEMAIASTEAVAISPTEAGLADFRGRPIWRDVPDTDVRPWTDDYVNLFGALWRAFRPPPERP